MRGAEQLSQAVLRSDPEVVRRDHDLTAQLKSRSERLSWLISFIGENMVQAKLSQRSKQRLATDAEKLYAARRLWEAYNELLEYVLFSIHAGGALLNVRSLGPLQSSPC